ncbi:endoplasmic oxidoreductin-1 [Monosporozyma unispora]|nr:endoplasmic oxidoreductin-1 [Kazachstania unispora]
MKLDSILLLSGLTSLVVGQDNSNTNNNNNNNSNNNSNAGSNSVFQQNLSDLTPFCKMDKDEALGPNCDATITEINNINKHIRNDLIGLANTDFFKYFKFDPFKKCTIWENNDGLCFSRSCAIDMVTDWDKLPEYWQPEILGALSNDTNDETLSQDHKDSSFLGQLCDNNQNDKSTEKDFPDEDDDGMNYYDINDFTSEDAGLVDLSVNPERFTGYGGQQAGQIWKSIYAENCFDSSDNETEQCLAKDAFYRIVSGLHASIGTHLSNDHLNTETGEWGPDLDLFMMRVGNFPDRVSNIYFNYAIVAKALWKIKPYLKELDFCNDYDNDVKSKILNIVSQLDNKIFNEDVMFKGEIDSHLKDDFRRRFKNVTRIMDCVHCDRCKLWGKVQTTGYATSLKILFELNEADEASKQRVVNKLTKFELISLINTFNRLSTSIASINNFEKLYHERENQENNKGVAAFFNNNFFKIWSKAKDTLRETLNGSTNDSSLTQGNLNDSIEPEPKEQQKEEEVKKLKKKEGQSSHFVDLKIPKKVKKALTGKDKSLKKKTIKEAWDMELHNYLEAVKFVWRSYLDLPRNIWRMIISSLTKIWNSFIGFTGYVSEEDKNPIVYKLDIKS